MTLSAVARAPEPAGATEPKNTNARPRGHGPVTVAVIVVAVVAGIVLRLYSASPFWLDEALTANIAGDGLGGLRAALERDGAPPLYYGLLAVWTDVVGDGDISVRLLSAVFSIATLPLAYRMGARRGGATVAAAALVLLATSPFAIRYATEARMYSLVALLVSLGWLALVNAIEKPSPGWLVATGSCAGLLLLTHYWAFYLVGATVVALAIAAWKRPTARRTSIVVIAAIVVGSIVLFAPWLPTFLSQLRHTGTPWGTPPGPIEVAFTTLVDLGGGPYPEGQALAATMAALVLLAVFGLAVDRHRIELDLRTRAGVRADLAVGAAALLAGVGVGFATQSAWASRYTSIAFPIIVLVAAYGIRSFGGRAVATGVLVVAAVLGVAGGVRNLVTDRTQAEQVVTALEEAGASSGDVVVYCPDQLGPGVHRLLPGGFDQFSFPDLGDPRFVNWVDYETRMDAADPGAFAAEVLDRARGHDVFYVWMPGYRTLDKKCERVNDALATARPGARQLLDPEDGYFERQVVWLHPARAAQS